MGSKVTVLWGYREGEEEESKKRDERSEIRIDPRSCSSLSSPAGVSEAPTPAALEEEEENKRWK